MPLTSFALVAVEPMTGIEPAYSAWEADSRFEQKFCAARSEALAANSNSGDKCGFGTSGTRIWFGAGKAPVRSRSGYLRGICGPTDSRRRRGALSTRP